MLDHFLFFGQDVVTTLPKTGKSFYWGWYKIFLSFVVFSLPKDQEISGRLQHAEWRLQGKALVSVLV